MGLWPYGTRVRDGAPATVDLAGEDFAVFFNATPLAWAAPIYDLFRSQTINVAELCATDPPPAETWNTMDIVNALNPAMTAWEDAKITRMAKASIWPTYCEYVNPSETTTYAGRPRLLETGALQHSLGPLNPTFDEAMLGYAETDFWVMTIECTTAPTDVNRPAVEIIRPAGWTGEPAAQPGFWPSTDVGVQAYFIPKHGPIWNVLTGYVELEPNEQLWRFHAPTSGNWNIAITAWALDLEPVPVPEPWAPAPTDPFIGPLLPNWNYQFSDECAANLCDMAENWGMAIDGLADTLATILAAINNLDIPGAPPLGFTVLPPEAGVLTGSNVLSIPPEMCGIGIYVNPPDYVARRGVEPQAMFDVGHYALGASNGWLTSVALKHSPHLVYPFPDGLTRIAIDLPPSVWVEYFWLQRNVAA
jgi:hypothetical protein